MLVARAARSPNDAELQAVVAKVKERFRGRAGRIETECPESCALEVDGRAPEPDAEGWVAIGPHIVVLTTDAHPGHRDNHQIEVLPLETTHVRFVRPAVAAVVPPRGATTRGRINPGEATREGRNLARVVLGRRGPDPRARWSHHGLRARRLVTAKGLRRPTLSGGRQRSVRRSRE